MGLSWQQGPLGAGPVGRLLTPDPLPPRLLYAEPLRRRMRVRFGGEWIADSEHVLLLHEPARYPVAYFPLADVRPGVLVDENRSTRHRDLGDIAWFTVTVGDRSTQRSAWRYTALPEYAGELSDRVGFAWRAMDAFYEEDERIVGHAADPYHRIDVRQTSRHLVVRAGGRVVADTTSPLVLYESGFAPRWYVPRDDVNGEELAPEELRTFCPYKGIASYYEIDGVDHAAWSYRSPIDDMPAIADLVSFEPDRVEVTLDGERLALEPGQTVVSHGVDRNLGIDEVGGITAVLEGAS